MVRNDAPSELLQQLVVIVAECFRERHYHMVIIAALVDNFKIVYVFPFI